MIHTVISLAGKVMSLGKRQECEWCGQLIKGRSGGTFEADYYSVGAFKWVTFTGDIHMDHCVDEFWKFICDVSEIMG